MQNLLKTSGVSVEHGAGLQFMRKLIDSLNQSNLEWLQDVSEGEITTSSLTSKSCPLNIPIQEDKQLHQDCVGNASFTIELNFDDCDCEQGSGSASVLWATKEEMRAFQSRPMQHFNGQSTSGRDECNIVERYLCLQQETFVKSASNTLNPAVLDRFKWAERESGSIWLERLKTDFRPQFLRWDDAGPEKPKLGTEISNLKLQSALLVKSEFTKEEWDRFGIDSHLSYNSYIKVGNKYFKTAFGGFELKCFGARELQQMDNVSSKLDNLPECINDAPDVNGCLGLLGDLKSEMDQLLENLLRLMVFVRKFSSFKSYCT